PLPASSPPSASSSTAPAPPPPSPLSLHDALPILHGITGPSLTLNTACSAGGDAVMTAAMLLRAGEADAILAVGGESILCPVVVSDRKSTRLNSSHVSSSYALFCLKKTTTRW